MYRGSVTTFFADPHGSSKGQELHRVD